MSIRLKRIYDKPAKADGCRVLVDRVWPRGIKTYEARVDLWLKEIAPSKELRKWFGHDPEKWSEFKKRYFRELDDNPEARAELSGKVKEGTVTLLFGAREERYNNAVALKEYLE